MKYAKILCAVIFALLLTACQKECVHEYTNDIIKEADCIQTGVERHTCINCEEFYETEIPQKEHDFSEIVEQKDATCAEAGHIIYACTSCGEQNNDEVPTLEHTYGDGVVQKEATCSEPGILAFSCVQCENVKEEEIPVISHTFGEPVQTKAPNCTEKGEMSVVCTLCNYAEFVEYIPTNGQHNMQETVKKASTCTEKGNGENKCIYCSYTEPITYGLADHQYGDFTIIQEATCSAAGTKEHVCKRCGYKEQKTIDKVAHTWDQQTCNSPATCTICGYYNSSGVAHKYEYDSTKEPSQNFIGLRIYVCTNCGERRSEYFGKTGDYDLNEATNIAQNYAKSLGFKLGVQEDFDPNPHRYSVMYAEAESRGGQSYIKQMAKSAIDSVYRYCEEELSGAEYYTLDIKVYYTQSGAVGTGYFGVEVYIMCL